MIERLRAWFNPEQHIEEQHDGEKERSQELLTRRKHRVTQHLENIYKEQQRLEALQTASVQFQDKQKYEGGFAATQMLIGGLTAPIGLLLRRFEPHGGSIIAYQGAYLFMRGAMTFINRVLPESRGSVEARSTGQRKKRKGAAAKELITEVSVQERIQELSEATRTRQQEFREFRRAYVIGKKTGFVPERSQDESRENYLRGYIAYLDALIDGQQENLEGGAGPQGLVELAKSLKEYHMGIAGHHQKRADVIGTGLATLGLLGAQQYFHGSPVTTETVAAIASGFFTLAGTALGRRGKKESALSHIESIDREVEELKRHRLETTLRLERLTKKRKRTAGDGKTRTESIDATSAAPEPSRILTPAEEQDIQEIMHTYRLAVQEIIHRAPPLATVLGTGQALPRGVSAAPASSVAIALSAPERGALSGFLGVSLEPARAISKMEPPPSSERGSVDAISQAPSAAPSLETSIELPVVLAPQYLGPAVESPSKAALLQEISRNTIQDRLIGDHIRIIRGDKKYAPTAAEIDQPIDEMLLALARDEATSRDVIESILSYDTMLIKNLQELSPPGTIVGFFGIDDFIRKLREVRTVLEKILREKEEKEAQIFVRTPLSLGVFLGYIPYRYGMGMFERGEQIAPEVFTNVIEAWQRSKEVGKISKNSLIRFLRVCYAALSDLRTRTRKPEEKELVDQKRRAIRAALKIVDVVCERQLASPREDERGFTRDLRNLCDEYRDDQKEHTELQDTTNLDARIDVLNRDRDYIFARAPSGTSSEITEASIISLSDSQMQPDPENQMVRGEYPVSVPPELVVGSFTFQEKWVLDADRQYVIDAVKEIMERPEPALLRKLLIDPQGKPRIELIKISCHSPLERQDQDVEQGEEYPIYLVKKGHEYVAAAKIAGIPIIAQTLSQRVPSEHYPLYVQIPGEHIARASELQGLEKRNLIGGKKGDIPQAFNADVKTHRATVRTMAFPGLLFFSTGGEMFYKLYEQLFKRWPQLVKVGKDARGNEVKTVYTTTGEEVDMSLITSRFAYRSMAS